MRFLAREVLPELGCGRDRVFSRFLIYLCCFIAFCKDFRIDVYFSETWSDYRLAHSAERPVLINEIAIYEKLWHPDIYFANAKHSNFHTITTPNFVVWIYPNGTVFYDTRISMVVNCMMHLENYPLDQQECYLRILSYAYDRENLNLTWRPHSPITFNPDIRLPDMELLNYAAEDCSPVEYATGKWSCALAVLNVRREVTYHILQSYVPSGLMVIISKWSCALAVLNVRREVTYHILQSYVPSGLMVIISKWSCALAVLNVRREVTYHILQSYVPSGLMVIISKWSCALAVLNVRREVTYHILQSYVPSGLMVIISKWSCALAVLNVRREVTYHILQSYVPSGLMVIISKWSCALAVLNVRREVTYHILQSYVPSGLMVIISKWSCALAVLNVRREVTYHILQSYVPSGLMVIISWFSFWLDVDAVPGRVSLCITTLLTLATQSSGARMSLPQVSYAKAIDVWMGTCMAFVFGVMIQFSAINYLSRRRPEPKLTKVHDLKSTPKTKKKMLRELQQGSSSIEFHDIRFDPRECRFKKTASPEVVEECGPDEAPGYGSVNQQFACEPEKPQLSEAEQQKCAQIVARAQALRVDKICRVAFPISFLLFNICYWAYYLTAHAPVQRKKFVFTE